MWGFCILGIGLRAPGQAGGGWGLKGVAAIGFRARYSELGFRVYGLGRRL